MLIEYLYIYLLLCFSIILSLIMLSLSMVLIARTGDVEKISAYECGFHPFEDARAKFDVRFYLVAILFIIFDLEITFFISLVYNIRKNRSIRILVNDGIFMDINNRFCL